MTHAGYTHVTQVVAPGEYSFRGGLIDIFPMGADAPLYALDNTVLTPHLGYVVEESFRPYYEDTVEAILAWLDGKPLRVVNEEALARLSPSAGKATA